MHAWINPDRGYVHTILPSEYDPEDMGPIYKMTYVEGEVLDMFKARAKQANRDLEEYERMLAATLAKRGPVEGI